MKSQTDQVQTIAETLKGLIKLMVDSPDEVSITATTDPSGATLRLSVAPSDTGKVIGMQGRTARSLRVILGAISKTSQINISLDIAD